MERYNLPYPGSFIEEKEFSVAWHYRNAAQAEAKLKGEALITQLCLNETNSNLEVMHGNKIIEVRIKGVNKGDAVKEFLAAATYDFILAMGDDVTDEDMFRELIGIPEAHSIGAPQPATNCIIPVWLIPCWKRLPIM